MTCPVSSPHTFCSRKRSTHNWSKNLQLLALFALIGIGALVLIASSSSVTAADEGEAIKAEQPSGTLMRRRYRQLQEKLKRIQLEMKTLNGEMASGKSKAPPPAAKPLKKVTARAVPKKHSKPKKLANWRSVNQAQYEKAYTAFITGDYGKAEQLFLEFLKQHPGDSLAVSSQVWLAEIYNSQGDREKAIRYFTQAQSHQEHRSTATAIDVQEDKLARPSNRQATAQTTPRHKYSNTPLGTGKHRGSKEDIFVNLGDRVFFETDSSELTDQAMDILTSQVRWLKNYTSFKITIEGHADERGTREYNLALGAKRADKVRDYLFAQGINAARLRVLSYGKERPVALCDNISCWAQNRRAITRLSGAAQDNKLLKQPTSKKPLEKDFPKEVQLLLQKEKPRQTL